MKGKGKNPKGKGKKSKRQGEKKSNDQKKIPEKGEIFFYLERFTSVECKEMLAETPSGSLGTLVQMKTEQHVPKRYLRRHCPKFNFVKFLSQRQQGGGRQRKGLLALKVSGNCREHSPKNQNQMNTEFFNDILLATKNAQHKRRKTSVIHSLGVGVRIQKETDDFSLAINDTLMQRSLAISHRLPV